MSRARAHAADPWEPWYRLAEAEVRAVRAALPAPLREQVAGLPVELELEPGPALLDEGLPDDLLGLFSGPAYGEETSTADPFPPRVTLFIANLCDEAQDDADAFRQEVRTTLLHELGHYLGLEENDLAERHLE